MKKLKTLIAATLCLCAVCTLCAAPASALEYTFSAPSGPEYGKPTSFEPVVTADGGAMKNENLSKSAALIPPGFGTPTSYLPGSGEYLTPNLVPSQTAGAGTVNGSAATVTPPTSGTVSDTGSADSYPATDSFGGYPSVGTGYDTAPSTAVGFTEVTSGLYYSDGSLGTLKIPSIGVTVKVYEGTDTAALAQGAGHFEGTSIWDGNVSFAGHNRGMHGIFGDLHTLNIGDIITLTTVLGTRTYAVTGVARVSMYDTSGLGTSAANMLTIYTCVENQPAYRWCITAVAVDG